MKVTVYGDSILKGILLENGKYTVNREWERRISGDLGLEIRNRSRFGCTIRKAMDMIRRDSAQKADGEEVAVLEFGGNDCDYNWEEIAADPGRDYDCKTPPKQFMESYREAVRLLRASGRTPVLLTLPPIHSERYLRFICRNGLSRENILSWLGDVDAIYRWQAKYSEMVRRIAAEEHAGIIDLREAFLHDGRPAEELLCADGIHPSRTGQSVIFETLRTAV